MYDKKYTAITIFTKTSWSCCPVAFFLPQLCFDPCGRTQDLTQILSSCACTRLGAKTHNKRLPSRERKRENLYLYLFKRTSSSDSCVVINSGAGGRARGGIKITKGHRWKLLLPLLCLSASLQCCGMHYACKPSKFYVLDSTLVQH